MQLWINGTWYTEKEIKSAINWFVELRATINKIIEEQGQNLAKEAEQWLRANNQDKQN